MPIQTPLSPLSPPHPLAVITSDREVQAYAPLTLPGMPDPQAVPADPGLRLTFWQAQARACAFVGWAGNSEQTEMQQSVKRSMLVRAAADLNTAAVADLLDDPEVLRTLRGPSGDAQVTHARLPTRPWFRVPKLDPVLNPEHDETPLEVVLYADPGIQVEQNPTRAYRWYEDALLAQELLVELLLAAGETPTATVWLAAGFAANPRLIDRLVAHGHAPILPDDPRVRAADLGSSPLHLAAEQGWSTAPAVMARLVDLGWPVDTLNSDRRTPLHSAILHGHPASVRWLLEHGATLTWTDHQDHALGVVASQGWAPLVDLLRQTREAGAMTVLNAPDEHGLTPLDRAVRAGHTHTADRLLEHGATITDQTMPLVRALLGLRTASQAMSLPIAPLGASVERNAALQAMAVRLEGLVLRDAVATLHGNEHDPHGPDALARNDHANDPQAVPSRPRSRL